MGGGRTKGLGNVALKKAVNFAIDRTAMLEPARGLWGSR